MPVRPLVVPSIVPLAFALGACGGGGGGGGGGSPDEGGPTSPDILLDAPATSGPADGAGSTDPAGGTDTTDPVDGADTTDTAGSNDATGAPDTGDTGDVTDTTDTTDTASPVPDDKVTYAVVLENFWNADDFPQGFPEDAHLSHVGGATHNASISFWEPGGIATEGVEDLAERGVVDLFLAEDVDPAIAAGLADTRIAKRRYTDPQVDGVPGRYEFPVEVTRDFPRVTLLTMLGPSPDWFVGIDGVPLLVDGEWLDELSLDLPLYDGGSKSNIVPLMDGPGIHPNDPIRLIGYDEATGTYLPRDAPQIVARLLFTRTP